MSAQRSIAAAGRIGALKEKEELLAMAKSFLVFLQLLVLWTCCEGEGVVAFNVSSAQQPPSDSGGYRLYVPGGGARARGGGLSYIYYINSCPRAYDIVRERVQFYTQQDPSHAAGILRVFFHDCFVQGCDASVLLKRPVSEQTASPNINSLRTTSFRVIDEIKASLEVACPGVVSCADTLALAARDAVFMVGGPWIPIMTGRKDRPIAASNQTVTANIPDPTQGFSAMKQIFDAKGLNVKDLVALSGGHTIGQTHCRVVDTQLMPSVSNDLSPSFAANLSRICFAPQASTLRSHVTVHLDGMTPNTFDNAYYKNVVMKRAVFHSDAALLDDEEAKSHVHTFARSQAEFFKQFSLSFFKMSQIGVLTTDRGEVRMSCTIPN